MPKVGPESAHFSPGCVEDVWPRRWRGNKERGGADSIPQGEKKPPITMWSTSETSHRGLRILMPPHFIFNLKPPRTFEEKALVCF